MTPSSDDLARATQRQLEREIGARQKLARGCGIALIELTDGLEGDDVRVDRRLDPLGLVLIAFASRGRRLLRAAYGLLDAGSAPEAVPLLRILSEYLIVASWLDANPDKLHAWAIHDLDRRDLVMKEVFRTLPPDDEANRENIDRQRAELAERRREWSKPLGDEKGHVPKVEVMAKEVGLDFAYQLAYRIQSRSDVHATPLAADSCYQQHEDGTLRLLRQPLHGLATWDQIRSRSADAQGPACDRRKTSPPTFVDDRVSQG